LFNFRSYQAGLYATHAPLGAKADGNIKKRKYGGFILKSKSPSCGIERVKVYDKNGVAMNKGRGLFVRDLREHLPLVPITDEKGIHNPQVFKNFIDKIFVFRRWREFLEKSPSRGALIKFQNQKKFLILSRSPKQVSRMENVIVKSQHLLHEELMDHYQKPLIDAF